MLVKRKGEEVSIVVKDNGIGIAAEKISNVFDMFTQIDPHQKTESGCGLGIGLNIVQRMMQMHNGAPITAAMDLARGVNSACACRACKGSTFTRTTKPATEQGGTAV